MTKFLSRKKSLLFSCFFILVLICCLIPQNMINAEPDHFTSVNNTKSSVYDNSIVHEVMVPQHDKSLKLESFFNLDSNIKTQVNDSILSAVSSIIDVLKFKFKFAFILTLLKPIILNYLSKLLTCVL